MSTYKFLLRLVPLVLLAGACAAPDVPSACVTDTDCVDGFVCEAGTCTTVCIPKTCAEIGKDCGEPSDGCGGTLNCGSCSAPKTCGGGGKANECGVGSCTSESDDEICARLGKDCDAMSALDDCGNTRQVNCGSCSGGETCGGAGTANECGLAACTAETNTAFCARYGKNCNSFTQQDNCGDSRTVNCGSCSGGDTCGGGGLSNVCGQPGCTSETNAAFCSRLGKDCGVVTANDNCGVGRSASCGSCTNPEVCGTDNVCACMPETDAQFCSRLALTCGAFTGLDNCGNSRSVASCGTCSGGQTCGGDNTCGCGPCGANAHCDATAKACVCDGGYVGDGQSCGLQSRCDGRLDSSDGTFCHYSPVAPGLSFDAVHGASSNAVWAVSFSGIFRWDGSRWHVESETIGASDVWAISATDVWAVSTEGHVLHRDANGWTNLTPEAGLSYYGVWGSSANDVWVVGSRYNGTTYEGFAFRWNGSSWSSRTTLTPFPLSAIWGSSANDVWAVGDSCTLARWNGTAWSQTDVPSAQCPTYSYFSEITGSSANDVWIEGSDTLRWNGSTWSSQSVSHAVLGIHARSGTQALAVGYSTSSWAGAISRWNGSTWSQESLPVTGRLKDAWIASTGEAWAVGESGALLRHTGTAWRDEGRMFSDDPYGVGISGSGSANVMFASPEGVFRWNGSAWASASAGLPSLSSVMLHDLHVVSPTSAFLLLSAATPEVWRWNGTTWSKIGITGTNWVGNVYALSHTDAWAVGRATVGGGGVAWRWNGITWSAVTTPAVEPLDSVWAASANDAWAVGDGTGSGSEVVRWNGTAWSKVTTSISQPRFVTGSGPNDVWILDGGGRAYHRTTGSFAVTTTTSGSAVNFRHLISYSANDAWAISLAGLYQWDGTGWTLRASLFSGNASETASAIWRSSAGDIWVLGSKGTLVTNKQ